MIQMKDENQHLLENLQQSMEHSIKQMEQQQTVLMTSCETNTKMVDLAQESEVGCTDKKMEKEDTVRPKIPALDTYVKLQKKLIECVPL